MLTDKDKERIMKLADKIWNTNGKMTHVELDRAITKTFDSLLKEKGERIAGLKIDEKEPLPEYRLPEPLLAYQNTAVKAYNICVGDALSIINGDKQ